MDTSRTTDDFSSLLKQFNQAAKRAAETRASSDEVSDERRRTKRPRAHHDESTPFPPPRDAQQLKIRLSFLCIGAQKAGTTWLFEMLRKIPGLGLPDEKEVHFWDWHRRKGLGWYSRQFPAGNNLKYGEITPCYLTLPECDIQEIRQLFPSLRIVFLARDLVERAWSALTMELRNTARGMEAGQFLTGDDAAFDVQTRNRIERESDPENQPDSYFMDRLKHPTHTARGDYSTGLRNWLQHFPKEQLLILDYRKASTNPEGLLMQILAHIGVDEKIGKMKWLTKVDLNKKFNVATGPSADRPPRASLRKQMERYLSPYAEDFNSLLRELGYVWSLADYK